MSISNKILSFLQRIGKALMVPIAVMPALGLLLRLGDKDLLGQFKIFEGWLSSAGSAAFGNNMAILFAIGIGFGLAKENNGVGGLAGFLGYTVMTNVAKSFNPNINMGVFGGIIAGIVGGLLYNKYRNIQVPPILGFFGGKRFVPIVTSLVCLILGLVFGFLWPKIQIGIDDFAYGITSMGAIGAGLFGLFNRLLIPIGVHHVLNTVFWYQLGSFTTSDGVMATGDISRFLAGDPTAGVFTAGFYPIMMFGLPAACLAMYVMAKKKRKAEVGGMFASLALTAILTGITEPIEFAFMFLSPVLYVVHAILTGVSLFITNLFGILHSFSFSAGLIDYVLYFGKSTKGLLLFPIGAIMFAIYYFVFIFFIKKFNLKTPGREDDDVSNNNRSSISNKGTLLEKAEVILNALGGKDNIGVLDNCITRLRLTLKDVSKMDEAALKKAGASGIIRLGSNNVQVIMGTLAEPLVTQIKKLM